MWRIYNESCEPDLQVKQHFFRNVFNKYYNIGFGTPERLKAEKDVSNKNQLIIEKRIHRLKYRAFYSILQEEADRLLTISFDCQKNQALPKLPDRSAYYSRQFSFYHFAIVAGNSKAKLTPTNVYSYYWDDTTHAKSSNEIISAFYNFLQNNNLMDNIKDVLKLLKTHFGDNWETLETLTFYKIVKERAQEQPENMIESPTMSDLCESGFTENNSYV
ncbi:unnamed protein product [Pieris brassicae]|uniref:Uncharacterized protein n=1 Tax=Pieris brassicae TaxID=7116 RepID=A0A9P0TNG2_PIEBR|nr:unnamed protein product [Pieris brassicae]